MVDLFSEYCVIVLKQPTYFLYSVVEPVLVARIKSFLQLWLAGEFLSKTYWVPGITRPNTLLTISSPLPVVAGVGMFCGPPPGPAPWRGFGFILQSVY
jgi:hypothetical protein